jgi:hypothetical protein
MVPRGWLSVLEADYAWAFEDLQPALLVDLPAMIGEV